MRSLTELNSAALPRMSIVIPSYNQARYIESAMLSVLNQDYPAVELIVVDGCSTDGTREILQHYKSRLSHCIIEPDRGQSDALNKGFALATGDIFGWLNSDDVYRPNAFRRAAAILHEKPDKHVVFGDWEEIDELGAVMGRQYAFDFSLGHFLFEGFHLNAQSMFWRASAHRVFGAFDVELHRAMDYQLILRLGQLFGQSAFQRVPVVLGCFRRHLGQKTTAAGRDQVDSEHRGMAAKYGFSKKYHATGRVNRAYYRLRRAWWYAYRGGPRYLVSKICQRFAARVT